MKTSASLQVVYRLFASTVVAAGMTTLASHAAAQTTIKIDGSSTVFPVTQAASESYQETKKDGVKFTINMSGTGGGFKKFCKGETDISNASRPILKKEMDECKKNGIKYVELPVAFDALTVVVSRDNKFLKQMTVEELKKLWEPAAQTTITTWDQVNPAWPKKTIKLFGPGKDSGTFDYFTEAVNGKSKVSRTDYFGSEDDNVVVQAVSRNPFALGYFGYSYYLENAKKLKAVAIVNPQGKAITPSIDAVKGGKYVPLARPLFIYVNAKSEDRAEVMRFVEHYLENGSKIVKDANYITLGASDYAHALRNFKAKKTGTAFGGEAEVGVTISELLHRDPKE
jgi:phosphate transport system substrate-binding protein